MCNRNAKRYLGTSEILFAFSRDLNLLSFFLFFCLSFFLSLFLCHFAKSLLLLLCNSHVWETQLQSQKRLVFVCLSLCVYLLSVPVNHLVISAGVMLSDLNLRRAFVTIMDIGPSKMFWLFFIYHFHGFLFVQMTGWWAS